MSPMAPNSAKGEGNIPRLGRYKRPQMQPNLLEAVPWLASFYSGGGTAITRVTGEGQLADVSNSRSLVRCIRHDIDIDLSKQRLKLKNRPGVRLKLWLMEARRKETAVHFDFNIRHAQIQVCPTSLLRL